MTSGSDHVILRCGLTWGADAAEGEEEVTEDSGSLDRAVSSVQAGTDLHLRGEDGGCSARVSHHDNHIRQLAERERERVHDDS